MFQKFINFVGPYVHFNGRCNVPESIALWEVVLMLLRAERPRDEGKTIASRSSTSFDAKSDEIDKWGGILVVDCKNRLEIFEKFTLAQRCFEEAWDRWESREDLRDVCLSIYKIMENIDENPFFWHDSQEHKFTDVHKEKIKYALAFVSRTRKPELPSDGCQKDEGLLNLSSSMKKVQERLALFARCDYPVLIQGETGTGKELVAKAIHNQSERSHKVFLPLIVPPFQKPCWKTSCSATARERLPELPISNKDY